MNKQIAISNGKFFLISDIYGNISSKNFQGFFFEDSRHVSYFQTLINNEYMDVLTVNEVDHNRAVYVRTNRDSLNLSKNSVTVIQDRVLDDGMFEEIKLVNNLSEQITFFFEINLNVDFADIFEVKNNHFTSEDIYRHRDIKRILSQDNKSAKFSYSRDGYERETSVEFSQPFQCKGDTFLFDITLGPKETKEISITLSVKNQQGKFFTPNTDVYNLSSVRLQKNTLDYPRLKTDWNDLKNLYEKSIYDLNVLKIKLKIPRGDTVYVPAAGLPWFMTLFGRDSAITAYQMLGFDNSFAVGVLKALADYQGKVVDPDSEEEPGKILHELRFGEAAHFGDWVKFPYYGSIDSTLLFLKLYVGLYKYYGNTIFFSELKSHVLRAIEWVEEFGDTDNDLFIEYHKKTEKGLRNQNWRDSNDSMMFSDGSLAETPIASADIQGYCYDVKMSLARIAVDAWKDEALGKKLLDEAKALKDKFNKSFWLEEAGYFAMGLDKNKRKIDTPASSQGHLLWSEIVEEDKKQKVVDNLMSEDLYSGWGIRTIARSSPSFNALGYHLGTVWPHDNSIAARGLYKNGFRKEAMKIIEDMIDSSKYFDYRLPELFTGYSREDTIYPVSYPTSASPQAWAAAASLQFIKLILGIDLDYANKKIQLHPLLPEKYKFINLKGFQVFGKKYDLTVDRGQTSVVEIE